MKITAEIDVPMDVTTLAKLFCNLGDELQAQFFIECAKEAAKWDVDVKSWGASWQWKKVGGHLRDCECSTPEARQMVTDICEGMWVQP